MKALISIDASNLHYFCQANKWKIDWELFRNYFNGQYENIRIMYYEGIRSLGHYRDYNPHTTPQEYKFIKNQKKRFFRYLNNLGFTVRHKVTSRFYDHTLGRFIHKCNFDVEITIDAIDLINSYDEFVLVSGDGDFEKLIRYLKGKEKTVTVVAGKDSVADKLLEATNRQVFLDDLRGRIEKKIERAAQGSPHSPQTNPEL